MSVITQAILAAAAFLLFANHMAVFAQAPQPKVSFVQASNVACKVGRPNVKSGETVTWQGQCADGSAQGMGVAQWSQDGKPTLRFEGTFAGGLLEGKGKMTAAEGDRYEGEYKGGLRHGHGIYVSGNGARFEGEYVNNQRAAASASSSPSTAPLLAQPQIGQAPAQAGVMQNSPAATEPQAAVKDGKTIADLPASPSTNMSGLTFSNPLCGPNVVYGVLPKGMDLRAGPPSGTYELQGNGSASLFASLDAAVRFAKEKCPQARPTQLRVFFYLDQLPQKLAEPGPGQENWPGVAVFAGINMYGGGKLMWNIRNHVADSYVAEQRKQQVAMEQRRAEEKMEADRASAAAAQKKAADRDKANVDRVDQFAKKHSLSGKEAKGLYANPFAFEGDRLFLVVAFEQMQSASSGLFYLPKEGVLVVNDIPKGAFVQKRKVLLAAKVLGNVRFDGVVSGTVQVNGMVPNLKFLGALICDNERCDQMDEK